MGCQECSFIGASGDWHNNVRDYWPSSSHRGDPQTPERLTGFSAQTQELAGDLALIFDEAFDLLLRKHENYGPMNVAGAPGHKKPTAINGLLVRMHDKQARMRHMYYNDREDQVGEDLRETAMDLLNYCAILISVLQGSWPTEEA